MTLEVWTARIGVHDPDALDITRGSGRGALAFAPSEAILWPAINARRAAEKDREMAAQFEAREEGAGVALRRAADAREEQAWVDLEPKYLAEMRVSFGMQEGHKDFGALERLAVQHGVKPDRAAWRALLARRRVVLACFCTNPERCHRRLLARILARCGAVDRGELKAPSPLDARRDLKPDNLARNAGERAALTALVGDFLTVFEEYAGVI